MKKLLNNLAKNKGYFSLTLLVGIIFSGISVLTPTVSGDMITAFTEDASAGSRFLILYLLVGLCQIVFSLLDAYMGMQFQLRQKRMMRSNVFRTFSRKDSAGREKISSFVSYVNNDIPTLVEQYSPAPSISSNAFSFWFFLQSPCCLSIGHWHSLYLQ